MRQRAIEALFTVIYPQACRVCGTVVELLADGVACSACWSVTRLYTGDEKLCSKCGALQSGTGGMGLASCPNCHDAYYDAVIAGGVYEKALAASVIQLKKFPHICRRLDEILVNISSRIEIGGPTVIIPVPLSRSRAFERGFNQAAVIAARLAALTGIDLLTSSLVRSRQTPMHRVAMDKRARELTVEKAFEIRAPRSIEGRDVILVDDVLTSGATASACARALKKNGAGKVTIATLARAVLYQ